jgi:immunoglobulin-like protein involved in spore germination/sporulation and spore germination protein
MKRFSLLIVGIGLLASACQAKGAVPIGPGPGGTPNPSPSPTSSPSASGTSSPSPTPTSNRKVTLEIWFLQHGQLFVTRRTESFSPRVAQLALDSLLEGPAEIELRARVRTAIPSGTTGSITDLSNRVATVELSDPFYNASVPTIRLRQAQVVYTLTQYPTIRRVRFGGGSGGASGRTAFDDLLPAILVESPIIGAKVSSPVTVSGTANVFEATVSLRILDENGKEIARTFTTATCGTGCRGDYSVSVRFKVDHEQQGTIEVFESSAKDGSAINVVDIPVTLMP